MQPLTRQKCSVHFLQTKYYWYDYSATLKRTSNTWMQKCLLCYSTHFTNPYFTHLLTELSPSWEAANCAATQDLPNTLWNPKVHRRVHKIQSLPSHPFSIRYILILSTHLHPGLPSGLLLHPLSLAKIVITTHAVTSVHLYRFSIRHTTWLNTKLFFSTYY
jgi:hypothetical protein